jgi:hypothetical protein
VSEQDWPIWPKGTQVVWRGRFATVEAHPGQVPVKLEGSGDVVLAWADDLEFPPKASSAASIKEPHPGTPVPGEDGG